MWKKIIGIIGILILLLIVVAIAAPFVFSGKLKTMAKKELNEQLNAKSGFKDVSISFFRHFPKLSVGLEGLYITGPESFAKDTLLAANRIDIAVNLFSLFGNSPVQITNVSLDAPRIHAIINKDGKVNWDIIKPGTDSSAKDTAASSFKINLKRYAINNGFIRYDDEQGNMHLAVNNLNHEGSGNFSEEKFLLKTSTKADAISFDYAGIPYLVKTATALDADFDIQSKESKYSFSNAKATLNEMEVNAEGFFQIQNDSTYNMDIRFNTPSNDFKNILSLVPAVYQKDFKQLKTKGTAAFNGFVKGVYSPTVLPSYNVNLSVKDGFFQYPDLPQPVQDINLELKASNADGQPDNTVVDIPKASLRFGNDPFTFRLLFKQPVSAQYIDAAAKGKLDLGTIGQFIKLENGTRIGGQINADIEGKGNLKVILKQQPGPFQASGLIELTNLLYASNDFPQPIKNTSARIQVSNPDGIPDHTVIQIPTGHAEFGNDKVDFTLNLVNPATDPAFDGSVKGGFQLDRVKQFYTFEKGTNLDGRIDGDIRFKGRKSMVDQKKYDAIQTSGLIKIKDLVYKTKDYPDGLLLKNANLNFTPKEINISDANGSFIQSNFNASGSINNAVGYAMNDEPLSGSAEINADKINLNKWMGTASTDEPSVNASSTPFAVPANIRFTLKSQANQVVYDKVTYNNVRGTVVLANETVSLQNLNMEALDGTIGLNGSYSTKESKLKPAISLTYQLNNLDVEQTFKAFNTAKYLMPAGEFISGKLNSSLTLNGKLGEEMMPDLNSLAGNGTILLIDGLLSKFKPLEELSSKLNIRELQSISVKDIKQYFEFVNGKVLVKPFKLKVSDINMEIGGMHGFDQSLDYVINLKIPREKLGNQANQLVNGLAAELSKKGMPVQLGETISLKANLGGTIAKPVIGYNLQQSSGSLANEMEDKAKEMAAQQKAKADSMLASTQKAARDSIESLKKQAAKDAQKAVQEQIFGKKDSSATGSAKPATPKKAEEAAKGIIDNLFKKKKPAADTTKKGQ
jgi:hypothetical protein